MSLLFNGENIKKFRKWIVTVWKKQSKTLEELLPYKKCQKMTKILGSWLQFVTNPLQKKEASSGFLEVGVLLAEDVGDPEATDVMTQGFC